MLAAVEFFKLAHSSVISNGFQWEIDLVENRRFENMDASKLKWEYLFVVLGSSGLNNRIVKKYYELFEREYKAGHNAFDTIFNGRIRDAVEYVWSHSEEIVTALRIKQSDEQRIDYIKTLPQMGKKTAYHFARNIGIDCIKPDIWMLRLAEKFGYYTLSGEPDPECMCAVIHDQLPFVGCPHYRIGTIDVILWRFCITEGL